MAGRAEHLRRTPASERIPQDLLPIEEPDSAEVTWPCKSKVWAGISTWTAYKGRRALCAICTLAIHECGVSGAPVPRAASWRRKGPNGDSLICSAHAEVMRRRDRAAEAARDEKAAHNAHLAQARRRSA